MTIIPGRVSPLKVATEPKLTIVSSIIPVEAQLQRVIDQLQNGACPFKSRRLKIIPHFRPSAGSILTREYKYVPKINLLGNWLHDAGFQIDGHVQVFPMNKLLVIRMEE